ncbi:type 2 periplasmic-binding domain-containing protein [Bowmanella dokdonensis]|uniref:Amino acid ABC transporter substrate-binding protein n=1 Tax=Bowmanella dokdonensis TaxID=751969 RepID=A0A939IQL9_9ALTE|nr:amino acid ABC transporter substrate-binding protein [Bowmanella dokdonensis]MBN7824717.1 amino acid ABC transporter substrate-binding protein [Bowmanella dokdonensis]
MLGKLNRKLLFLALLLGSASVQAATWNIIYPRPMSELDDRTRYPRQLLDLALQHTGVNYKLVPSDRIMLQSKALAQLESNREVNVVWSMTDNQREEDLLPIRIPIYKGLVGLRLALVKPKNRDLLGQVNSLDALLAFEPISGHDWPDTKILQANGFEVITVSDYDELFEALESEKGKLLPRSVVEIWYEYETHMDSQALAIEPGVALYYPTATYFFVNKKNQVLANLIENGLEKIIANGKFEELFLYEHQVMLENAHLDQRRIFRLSNPILPANTPLARKELWYPLPSVSGQ